MSTAQQMQQSQPRSAGTPGPQGTPVSSAQTTPLPGPPMNPGMQGGPPQRNVGMQQPDISKEKLITSIHEFLILNGGTKAAEAMKEEFSNIPSSKWATGNEQPPGYLHTWWSLFYDLYCAAPERRNEPEMFSTADAKMFHEFGFIPSSYNPPMMNGMHPQYGTHSPMMGPGPEGMMAGFAGRFGGRGPVGHAMGGAQYMFDPRMQQRPMPGRGQPPAFPGMRAPPPGHPAAMGPQGMYRPMMENCPPGPFPGPPGMPMNGGVMGAMPSPGAMSMQGGPQGGNGNYMMMPSSSSAMPFGNMGQPGDGQSQGGPPSHPGQIPSAHTPMTNGPASAGGMPGPSGTPHSAASSGGHVAGLLNGSELKHSPAGTPRGNGTPGPGGPGSAAPGSVHSGGAGSVPPSTNQQSEITPKQEPMDSNQPQEEENEIAKIKNSLIEDFGKEEVPAGGGYGY